MTTTLLAALLAPLALPCPTGADEVSVQWRGRRADLDRVTESLGEDVARTVARWAPFAGEREAGLHLSDDGRVLLVTRSKASKAAKELDLVEETIAAVDRWFPRPAEELEEAHERPVTGDPAAPAEPAPSARMPVPSDTGTVVLVQAEDLDEYRLVLDEVARDEPYLQEWKPAARNLAGFTLIRPLVATWIASLDGQEEWDVRNELVHRLTHLLVARRFGELPYWLQMGINWHVEEDLLGGIYCFPYRSQFVWASEHTSWPNDLAKEFRRPKPFFEQLTEWHRGTYQGPQARQAFGLARFLAVHHPESTPAILRELFDLRATLGVRDLGGGRWELIEGWEPSAEQQLEVLERHVGPDVLAQVVEYYDKGKRYRRPKPD